MSSPEDPSRLFRRILRESGRALARFAAGYAADAGDHEDLLQEILFAIWRALPAFRGDCSERTLVLRIGHNRGLTYRARRRRHYSLETADPIADPRANVELDAALAAARDQLLEAIRRLPVSGVERRDRPAAWRKILASDIERVTPTIAEAAA